MSLREKFAGGTGGTRGPSTDGGGNYNQGAASKASRMYAHLSPSTSSTAQNKVADVTTLGSKAATTGISSHNDINRFTSGISMHHPYKERGGAFSENASMYQGSNEARSNFRTPSGGGTGKKGASSATMRETRAPSPYDDPMKENTMPSDPSKRGGSASGPKGGTRALMNRMKTAGVNKMGWK
jgi:hypothetical protein